MQHNLYAVLSVILNTQSHSDDESFSNRNGLFYDGDVKFEITQLGLRAQINTVTLSRASNGTLRSRINFPEF